jgi:hypothetical protein
MNANIATKVTKPDDGGVPLFSICYRGKGLPRNVRVVLLRDGFLTDRAFSCSCSFSRIAVRAVEEKQ